MIYNQTIILINFSKQKIFYLFDLQKFEILVNAPIITDASTRFNVVLKRILGWPQIRECGAANVVPINFARVVRCRSCSGIG